VAHGKSTVVKAISGVHTVRFKNELERNITIKLGYANAKVRGTGTSPSPQLEGRGLFLLFLKSLKRTLFKKKSFAMCFLF